MRIVTLIENTSVNDKLYNEHGFSLFITHNGINFLVGTGSTGKLADNAKRMKLPLESVNSVVLCHNHTAETGGLDAIFKINPSVSVYAKAACAKDCYIKSGLFPSQTGLPAGYFKKHADNFILYSKFSQVEEGFFLASVEVLQENNINRDKTSFIRKGRKLVQDDFEQESFCVVFPNKRQNAGCVIIAPCAHLGIVNIIKTVQMRWSGVPVLAVIGGFHLMGKNRNKLNCTGEYVENLARELRISDVGTIYTNHCTGFKGYEILKEKLGDQIQYLSTGEELEF